MVTGAPSRGAVSPAQNGSNAKGSGSAQGPRFLDVEGLAGWLGIEVVFVRRLVAERRIPFVKIGRLVRFDPEEVAAWIDGQRVPPEVRSSRRVNRRS